MGTLVEEVKHYAKKLGSLRCANCGDGERLLVFLGNGEIITWGLGDRLDPGLAIDKLKEDPNEHKNIKNQ